MSFDEITTKIEIPKANRPHPNVVPVDFTSKEFRATVSAKRTGRGITPNGLNWIERVKELDLKKPWVLRLLAVLTVLILSMLIL